MTDHAPEDFIEAYNLRLEDLGCGARVRRSADASLEETLEIVDLAGKPLGTIPDDVEPEGTAAFMLIVERSFEDGFALGRRNLNA